MLFELCEDIATTMRQQTILLAERRKCAAAGCESSLGVAYMRPQSI